jgi:hypothetical protein
LSKTVSRTRSRLRWLGAVVLSAGLAAGPSAAAATKKTSSKPAAGTPATKTKVTSSKSKKKVTSKKRSRRARRGAWKRRGQQAIDQQRIRQIQEALVREKYLASEPTGAWDDRSRQAMMKYQQDNGWQTRVVPDSRALIKLGLGPSYAEVINPDSLPGPEDSPPPRPDAGASSKPRR